MMTGETFDGSAFAAALRSAMAARRSIRSYASEAVPPLVLERLLQAATLAPSAHNRQPWRFVVLRAPETKAKLARAMGERLAEHRARDGDDAAAIARDVGRSFARITGAPVVLLVCVSLAEMDAYPDAPRARAEFLMAVQSTAMAGQNLLLAAHAEGLAACWMCAPLFCGDVVAAALALPEGWQPQGLITLGRPAAAGKERGRKPLGEVVIER
jgi:coenzyme F420-0:L-glutamate ligase / coenzyme F420-1:gamma-L-glutamate ligase